MLRNYHIELYIKTDDEKSLLIQNYKKRNQ